jgi:hypothetical protein
MKKFLLSALLLAFALPAFAQDNGWDWSQHTGQDQNPAPQAPVSSGQPLREWTLLVFMNGHNNLDSYTTYNLKQMEKVGSTDRVNVVAQWASASAPQTRRVFVQKSTSNSSEVTSPIVQTLPTVDMGDYRELTNFIKWGAQNYPAKHYMVVVWNHGSGWHSFTNTNSSWNISFDDNTGHSIDTKQLGQAMADAQAAIGQKIDIYSSDACLMAMIEVAQEMAPSVNYFVGSEETEPMDGWPYDEFLQKWNALVDMTPAAVAKIVPEVYVGSYSGGSQGTEDSASMSAWDLSKLGEATASLKALKQEVLAGNDTNRRAIKTAADTAQSFTYADYIDVGDFVKNIESSGTRLATVAAVKSALSNLIIANADGANLKKATGLTIWMPHSSYDYSTYANLYQGLAFDKLIGWHEMIQALNK